MQQCNLLVKFVGSVAKRHMEARKVRKSSKCQRDAQINIERKLHLCRDTAIKPGGKPAVG